MYSTLLVPAQYEGVEPFLLVPAPIELEHPLTACRPAPSPSRHGLDVVQRRVVLEENGRSETDGIHRDSWSGDGTSKAESQEDDDGQDEDEGSVQ